MTKEIFTEDLYPMTTCVYIDSIYFSFEVKRRRVDISIEFSTLKALSIDIERHS